MKLIEKVWAYRSLKEMMKENWDFAFIYPLVKLTPQLVGDYDFFCREERKLVLEYGKKEVDGSVTVAEDGSFFFADEAARCGYGKAHRELEELEENVRRLDQDLKELETPPLPSVSVPKPQRIRGDWLRAIAPFCTFQGDESDHG